MHCDEITVSVVIPVYNSERYVARAISSVLSQGRKADEVIVVDDGSTDGTASEVAKFGDTVKYIYQENRGASAARNTGILAAESEWIAFLDADDEWLPDYLEKQSNILISNPQLSWSIANYYTCLQNGNPSEWNDRKRCQKLSKGKDYFEDYFLLAAEDINGSTNTTIVKKDALINVGLFDESLKKAVDVDLWWRIAYEYPGIGFVCEPLAIYYLEIENSLTSKKSGADFYRGLIQKHIELAKDTKSFESFRRFIAFKISRWARSMLFDDRCVEVRGLLNEFGDLLSLRQKIFLTILTIRPLLTNKILLNLSKVIRIFKLRKRLVKPPK